jgi:catechol 2,3-dioxygenase-like lactoylglutathione lyase family enzyme
LARPNRSLADFRQRAKRLLKRVRGEEPEALDEARLHPLYRGGVDPGRFALSDAQLVIARAEGFESWPRLAAAHSKEQPMSVNFNGLGMRLWVLQEHFDATCDFYGDALGLKCTWRSSDQGVATYEVGFGPTIVVERKAPAPGRETLFGRFTGLSLEVADIEAAYQAMVDRGVPFDGPPTRQPWGGIMAFFRDPAGNEHTLLQRPGKA